MSITVEDAGSGKWINFPQDKQRVFVRQDGTVGAAAGDKGVKAIPGRLATQEIPGYGPSLSNSELVESLNEAHGFNLPQEESSHHAEQEDFGDSANPDHDARLVALSSPADSL